jgi:hypothetical protein
MVILRVFAKLDFRSCERILAAELIEALSEPGRFALGRSVN